MVRKAGCDPGWIGTFANRWQVHCRVAGLPELTVTGDGQSWGVTPSYFIGTVATPALLQIDPKSGVMLKAYAYDSVPGFSSWAMKFWGGSFWIFADSSGYRTRREAPSKPELMGRYPRGNGIVGAGVSTCAPLQ